MFVWANKEVYKGEFKNNMMHGKGEYHWTNGKKFLGEWLENSMQKKKGKFIKMEITQKKRKYLSIAQKMNEISPRSKDLDYFLKANKNNMLKMSKSK